MKQIWGLGFDWTSREEVKAGSLAVVIFALGILAVSTRAHRPVILLTVPTALIYAQVGLVMPTRF